MSSQRHCEKETRNSINPELKTMEGFGSSKDGGSAAKILQLVSFVETPSGDSSNYTILILIKIAFIESQIKSSFKKSF